MATEENLSREDFDRQAELYGITGEPAYLDELYAQVRGIHIMAKTIKGKGFSFSENNNDWHHKIMTKQQYNEALEELSK